jgi:glucose-1-phosphate adenylyltransferase
MDYLKMLQYHISKRADLTIAFYVPIDQANRYGIVGIDEDYKSVKSFIEKPTNPPETARQTRTLFC